MACLLNIFHKNTIRQKMNRYLALVLAGSLIMNGATILFHLFTTEQHEKMMGQILLLNQFYVRLETCNSVFSSYTQKGTEEEYLFLESECEELEKILDNLGAQDISKSFTRDISDIGSLFRSYRKAIENVHEDFSIGEKGNFTSKVLSDISVQYSRAQRIYDYISQEFKNLHLTMLEFAGQQQSDLSRKGNIYFTGFLFILLAAAGWYGLKGRELAEQIANPILELTGFAEKIRDGKMEEFLDMVPSGQPTEEIGILVNVFNMMIRQIGQQIRVIRENADARVALQEKELENLRIMAQLRTSELRALQMQMNPHFLFNTLNMISRTAYLGEADKTVSLLQSTAQVLRYSLDYIEKSVTLAQEMEALGNYVSLQEQRFGERITFDFDLDERFHKIHIPCLILQPLVENSIAHGVGSYMSGGRITICTRYQDEEYKGLIRITDNGVGMSRDRLAQVRQGLYLKQYQSEKIGLANVYTRLMIFFDNHSAMEIKSEKGHGTEITIILPVDKEERDVPDDHSGRRNDRVPRPGNDGAE